MGLKWSNISSDVILIEAAILKRMFLLWRFLCYDKKEFLNDIFKSTYLLSNSIFVLLNNAWIHLIKKVSLFFTMEMVVNCVLLFRITFRVFFTFYLFSTTILEQHVSIIFFFNIYLLKIALNVLVYCNDNFYESKTILKNTFSK